MLKVGNGILDTKIRLFNTKTTNCLSPRLKEKAYSTYRNYVSIYAAIVADICVYPTLCMDQSAMMWDYKGSTTKLGSSQAKEADRTSLLLSM